MELKHYKDGGAPTALNDAVSPVSRIHGISRKRNESRNGLISHLSHDSFEECTNTNLYIIGLEALIPKKETLS
jgi:hypothetical protein